MPGAARAARTRSVAGYARLAVGVLALASAHAALAFGFNDVAVRAKQLAAKPYQAPADTLPRELRELRYDQYREIRFKSDQAYWRRDKLPFELGFFHEGSYYDQPVKINEVSPAGVREIRFDPRLFDYGPVKLDPKQLQKLGFAGFRVHYPMNTPKYKDEVIVFLGASYFRGIGKGQVYGLSARGLAIDTALNSGEEFPRFTDFWIERPAANAKELTIYALLNSRRATGAYRFVIKPGSDTAVDVKAQLYMRENVSKLAIAPLTSMFFFGENQPAARAGSSEVHDSDGLSVATGSGEWLWRPLLNPKQTLTTSFSMNSVKGFGLMQRDRNFASYEDSEARYELRPSAWVEPVGDWGAGRVELVQIPTPDETNDNVVAYWVPENPPKPQQPFNLEYRLLWQKDADKKPALAWVAQTRRSHGWTTKRPDERKPDDTIAFVVDFEGPALAKLAPNAPVEPVFSADANGKIESIFGQPNTATGGWRVTVRLKRVDDDKPVELRGYLRSGGTGLSETWSYLLPPG